MERIEPETEEGEGGGGGGVPVKKLEGLQVDGYLPTAKANLELTRVLDKIKVLPSGRCENVTGDVLQKEAGEKGRGCQGGHRVAFCVSPTLGSCHRERDGGGGGGGGQRGWGGGHWGSCGGGPPAFIQDWGRIAGQFLSPLPYPLLPSSTPSPAPPHPHPQPPPPPHPFPSPVFALNHEGSFAAVQHRSLSLSGSYLVQENLKWEQRTVLQFNWVLVNRIMSPIQTALFMVHAWPSHCDCLALVNTVYAIKHDLLVSCLALPCVLPPLPSLAGPRPLTSFASCCPGCLCCCVCACNKLAYVSCGLTIRGGAGKVGSVGPDWALIGLGADGFTGCFCPLTQVQESFLLPLQSAQWWDYL